MRSLANRFTQELRSASVAFERDADGALRVPARCRDVGELVIALDDDEISVFIGEFTHCHFTPGACGDLEGTDRVGEAVREAADFVRGVLADQWVLWRYPNGGGGCYLLGDEEDPMADVPLGEDAQCYLWSGPYSRGAA